MTNSRNALKAAIQNGYCMAERIANRTLELSQKTRRTRAEETELAILTYDGPVPRVLPPSDEVPF